MGDALDTHSRVAASISRRAVEFELPALLALLDECFPLLRVQFAGHRSRALEPTLVRSVEFASDAAKITLNVGLYSSTSPLPAYLDTLLDHPRAGAALEGLFRTVNEGLLEARAFALEPSRGRDAGSRRSSPRRSMLSLARPASPIGLRWLFEKVFPELAVFVRRAPLQRRLPAPAARLGGTILGLGALGGESIVMTAGTEVLLQTDESATWRGDPWTQEARRRLQERVLPAIAGSGVNLRVVLVDRDGRSRLVLHEQGELGFAPLERVRAGARGKLFEGQAR